MPKKTDILGYWIAEHGPLSAALKKAFLARKEVAELAKLPDRVVWRAIDRYRKLDAILDDAVSQRPGLISLDPTLGPEADF